MLVFISTLLFLPSVLYSSSTYLGFQLSFLNTTDGSCGGKILQTFSEEYTQCSPLKLPPGSQFFYNGNEINNSSSISAYCEPNEMIRICDTTDTCLEEKCAPNSKACFQHVYQGSPSMDVSVKCIWQNRTKEIKTTMNKTATRISISLPIIQNQTIPNPSKIPAQTPTIKPTSLVIPNYCTNPTMSAGKIQCASRVAICQVFGYRLKFIGDGCNVQAPKGGCQCDKFCGYTCSSACNSDELCVWQDEQSQCVFKANNQVSIPELCTPDLNATLPWL